MDAEDIVKTKEQNFIRLAEAQYPEPLRWKIRSYQVRCTLKGKSRTAVFEVRMTRKVRGKVKWEWRTPEPHKWRGLLVDGTLGVDAPSAEITRAVAELRGRRAAREAQRMDEEWAEAEREQGIYGI